METVSVPVACNLAGVAVFQKQGPFIMELNTHSWPQESEKLKERVQGYGGAVAGPAVASCH